MIMDAPPQSKRTRRTKVAEPAESSYVAPAAPIALAPRKTFSQKLRTWSYRRRYTLMPFLILLLALGYYYFQYRHLIAQNAPDVQSKAQIQTAVADVEKLMYVKDDTGAQLATITDISKLAGQKFFADAKNGDELVLFPVSQQAVLYRPSIGKIIEVGPYTPQATPAANTTAAPSSLKSPFKAATSTKSQ